MTAEQAYKKGVPIIHALAARFARNAHVDVDDLVGEAHSAFMRAYDTWNGEGEFTTYLWTVVHNALFTYVYRSELWTRVPDSSDQVLIAEGLVSKPASPLQQCIFTEKLESLSSEARDVVAIILDAPVETLGLTGSETPRKVRALVRDYLRAQGASWSRVWAVLHELKAVFS